MRGIKRVRRRLTSMQAALIVQALGWLITIVEGIHYADRTPEEARLLELAQRARAWIAADDLP